MGKKTQIKDEENGDVNMEELDASAKGGKKSKKSKKKDYDEDDVAKELEELNFEVNGVPPKPKENSEQKLEPDEKVEENSKPDKSKKEKTKKGKNKRKGNDDEDDIDDLLAEIEAEYTGEKPKKKEIKEKSPVEDEKDETDTVDRASRESSTKRDGKAQQKGKAESKGKKDDKRETKEKPTQADKKKDKKPVKESSPPVEDEASKKKKKGKTKEEKKKEEEEARKEEEAKSRKGKPNKKMLEAMKLVLAKQKEEEERMKREMEEKERQEQERIRLILEQRRLDEEKKERQKQKQKEKMKRLKEEGKLLTQKQRMDQMRAKAMLEHLKAQGVMIPEAGEKLPSAHVSYKRQKRKKPEEEAKPEEEKQVEELEEEKKEEEEVQVEEVEEEEDVVDAWDQISESEDDDDKEDKQADEKDQEDSTKDSKETEDSTDDEESENEEKHTEAEKRRERAVQRMAQRKSENEKKKSEERLRAPVVCVLGHVDHGKTKILDKLRRTNVQEGEVGGITQQIGATNVPFDAVKSQTRMVKDFEVNSNRLPGLLIIDTPGHESFSNLRTRGSSLCDIAILVVDITQGLEPQTIESINLLKTKKTPFVVALNKVDRVFEWESHPSKDIREIIKLQNDPCKNDFERRTGEVIQALNMQGLNASLFWENPDPRSYVSLVPTSAISGDGMGNLIALITTMCQKRLAPRLMFSEELQCTVLEVKTIQGHGTTIDVILINGRLKEGDTIILAGTEGPIVTQIRSLLIPKPMKEIRVKGQYDELKVVEAALGVKLAARELEKAIAGLNLQVALHEDEVDILKEEVDREFKAAMRSIKVKDKGVYVQASTLGALEALLEFFKTNKVPYAGIRVGPVVKRDVMKAAAMLEHDPMYAVILAFDVKVERDAQELADKEGIKIFSEETIYHLGDRYVEYIKEYKKKKQDEFRHISVFPCRLKIIPDAIFNKRDPIVLGVNVESGILRTGTPLCVPSKEFVEIGVVTSLEFDHKVVEIAKKGVNVCMKVEPVPGHTPKLFGRHFEGEDMLVSKITRESIDACKQYFRDDLGKTEWKLMADLKKQFGIL